MAITNACFISYRHSADPTARRIVEAFRDGLSTQLAISNPNARIFFDAQRLQAGSLFNAVLARELCQSSCMILLFNPYYFDPQHPYCAMEYQAMRRIEDERLAALPHPPMYGLIIPVVLRGEYALPKEVRDQRQFVSFDRELLSPADFKRRPLLQKLRDIAEAVERVHRDTQRDPAVAAVDCGAVALPQEADIRPWLEAIAASTGAPGFPGR